MILVAGLDVYIAPCILGSLPEASLMFLLSSRSQFKYEVSQQTTSILYTYSTHFGPAMKNHKLVPF